MVALLTMALDAQALALTLLTSLTSLLLQDGNHQESLGAMKVLFLTIELYTSGTSYLRT